MTLSRRHWLAALGAAGLLGAAPNKRGMIVRSTRPEDLEMPLEGFSDYLTPLDRFFVRSHCYTPEVDVREWRLEVAGQVRTPLSLTLDELKRMPRVEMVSVLECAGNGRSFQEPPVIGLQWGHGAVGNARWAGVRLRDVLARAGVKEPAVEVLANGADVPVGNMPDFQRSLPLGKALAAGTLLAYEMNGEPLPASHGFPLRLVVPGWAGDSWIKWVSKLTVLDKPHDGFWMATAYRYPNRPVAPGSAVDAKDMHPVEEINVKSVIASPLAGAVLAPGRVKISGAAWSGMKPVVSVEVSTDRGRTWSRAVLDSRATPFGWRLWECAWTPPAEGHYVLMARARDAAGRTQPFTQEWNPSGYLWNVVDQVAVDVGGPARPQGHAGSGPVSGPPDGYRAKCLSCHDENVISQQRLTRAQWEREMDKMIRWGAPVQPSERSAIVDYLVNRFGPRPR